MRLNCERMRFCLNCLAKLSNFIIQFALQTNSESCSKCHRKFKLTMNISHGRVLTYLHKEKKINFLEQFVLKVSHPIYYIKTYKDNWRYPES